MDGLALREEVGLGLVRRLGGLQPLQRGGLRGRREPAASQQYGLELQRESKFRLAHSGLVVGEDIPPAMWGGNASHALERQMLREGRCGSAIHCLCFAPPPTPWQMPMLPCCLPRCMLESSGGGGADTACEGRAYSSTYDMNSSYSFWFLASHQDVLFHLQFEPHAWRAPDSNLCCLVQGERRRELDAQLGAHDLYLTHSTRQSTGPHRRDPSPGASNINKMQRKLHAFNVGGDAPSLLC